MHRNDQISPVISNYIEEKQSIRDSKLKKFNPTKFKFSDHTLERSIFYLSLLVPTLLTQIVKMEYKNDDMPIEVILILLILWIIAGLLSSRMYYRLTIEFPRDLAQIKKIEEALQSNENLFSLRKSRIEAVRSHEEPYIQFFEKLMIDHFDKPNPVNTYLYTKILEKAEEFDFLSLIVSSVLESLRRKIKMQESGKLDLSNKSAGIQYDIAKGAYRYIVVSLKQLKSEINLSREPNFEGIALEELVDEQRNIRSEQ